MKSHSLWRHVGVACTAAAAAALTIPLFFMLRPTTAVAEQTGTEQYSPADLNRADVFHFIDQAHLDGKITAERRLLYRVAALKAPELLPPEWQRIVTEGKPSPGCYSHVMYEATQKLPTLPEPTRSEIEKLLLPPNDLAYTEELNSPYPIIVTYNNQALASKAQAVINSFITTYNRVNQDWGWADPPIEAPLNHYRFFISNTGMGAGAYTSPYDPDTSAWNCAYFSYIVIDDEIDTWSMPGTVAHEWGHACQAAFDTSEPLAFMENVTMYVSAQVFQDAWWYGLYSFQYFQAEPFRPLEYTSGYDMYMYGGGLYIFILEEAFANDDPVWIREVWEDSMQVGCYNEPDLFDTMNTKLAAQGGFQEAVKTIAEWRFFIGADDDGQHYPGSSQWPDAEVAKTYVGTSQNLPLHDFSPPTRERPQPNGCNYIVLTMTGNSQMPLRYLFQGDETLLWNVDIFLVRQGDDTVRYRMDINEQAEGMIDVQTFQGDKLVAIVCQIGEEGYDPDDQDWTAGNYTISIYYAAPAPTVTSITPNQIARGTQGIVATITGSGFVDSADTTVTFSGDSKIAATPTNITDTQITVVIIVGGTAELGPRDVMVTNPGGSPGTGHNLLTIIDTMGADGGTGDGTDNKKGKCNCRAVGIQDAPGLPVALVLLLVGLALATFRRKA